MALFWRAMFATDSNCRSRFRPRASTRFWWPRNSLLTRLMRALESSGSLTASNASSGGAKARHALRRSAPRYNLRRYADRDRVLQRRLRADALCPRPRRCELADSRSGPAPTRSTPVSISSPTGSPIIAQHSSSAPIRPTRRHHNADLEHLLAERSVPYASELRHNHLQGMVAMLACRRRLAPGFCDPCLGR
jgi:hypothetical protein